MRPRCSTVSCDRGRRVRTGEGTIVALRSAKVAIIPRHLRGAKGDNPTVIVSPVLSVLACPWSRSASALSYAYALRLSAQRSSARADAAGRHRAARRPGGIATRGSRSTRTSSSIRPGGSRSSGRWSRRSTSAGAASGWAATTTRDLPVVGPVHLAAGYLISEMLGCRVEYLDGRPAAGRCRPTSTGWRSPREAAFASPAFKRFEQLCRRPEDQARLPRAATSTGAAC